MRSIDSPGADMKQPTTRSENRLDWVLLANASRARLFERDAENGAMRELAAFVHPASRVKGSALGHDRPGHAAKGVMGTNFEPVTSLKEREKQHFAQQLAEHVEAAALDARMLRWMLIASSPFLGRLRAVLGSAAAARLAQFVDRDLSRWQGAELERRVAALLPLVAPVE
jgi:protein required for attachment to host cells